MGGSSFSEVQAFPEDPELTTASELDCDLNPINVRLLEDVVEDLDVGVVRQRNHR
jgi:hypothetical protein